MIVGRVVALWRYPVKSMLGERLERAPLGPDGVQGDRGLALRDVETGRVLSAKKVSRLLEARARTDGRTVRVTLPSGDELDVEEAATTADRIGAWLGRNVELSRPSGDARPMIDGEDGVFRGRAGGFFDSSAVHIVTTSTLERLGELHPGGRFDPRRFRPNVVLETVEEGFVEESWVGASLRLGGASVEITKPCSRCVMTTHAQDELPVDRDILRTVIEQNEEHVGVYGIVRQPGTVSIGDEAMLML
jgi:uncharacterized protein YcbX